MSQPNQKLSPEQYKQLIQNWNNMPVVWNPSGVYGGIEPVGGKGRIFLYFIPGFGALLILLGVFLPWLSITIFGTTISVNGIGSVSAPQSFMDGLQKLQNDFGNFTQITPTTTTSTTQPFEPFHGWILIVLAGISLILVIGGLAQQSKIYTIGLIICGVVCSGLTCWDLWKTIKLLDDTYKQMTDPTVALFSSIQTGFGLFMATFASLCLAIGAISTLIFFDRKN